MNATVENETTTRRKLFYQKLFLVDFFGDTMHMNGLEKRASLLLIGIYFMHRGHLPDDVARLALMPSWSVEQWQTIRPALERRFEVRDGLWRHEATERAITEAKKEYEARSRGGRFTRAKLRDQRLAEQAAQYLAQHPVDQPIEQLPERPAEHPAQPTQLQLQSEPLAPTSLDV